MRFQVPQFIEIEDKIFGPLTIKQFIYLAGGVGISTVFFTFFSSKFIAFVFSVPFIVFSVVLAFYKPQGRPFILIVESFFKYVLSNKLYIWKKEDKKIEKKENTVEDFSKNIYIPKLSDSKLSDLSWSLDIKEKLEDDINNN